MPLPPGHPPRFRAGLLAVTGACALAACSGDDDGPDPAPPLEPGTYAFVAGGLPGDGGGTGQIERLDLGEDDAIVSSGATAATGSDIRVATDGEDVYQLGRFQIDSLTRYAPNDLARPLWQYSVNGTETASNPHRIVFASETKAYVVRYGSPLVWIVDPSATTEANFLTGTIDLGAYDTVDGVPNATDAAIVDDRLFVLMQRLDETASFAPTSDGYVAVIDTESDTEVDTGRGEDGLLGIALESSNPERLYRFDAANELHVIGRGNIFGNDAVTADPYDGGLETIDLDTFETDLLVDDGTAEDNRGFLADALVISPSKGYLLFYDGFRVTTLRSFDPMTGVVADGVVAGLEDVDVSALAEAPDGRVWVGLPDDTAPGFRVLDPSDDSVAIERVATEFNPLNVVFVEVPAETEAPDGN